MSTDAPAKDTLLRTLKSRTALAAAVLAAIGIAVVTSLQSNFSERTVLASTVSQHEDYTARVAADIDKQLRLARASLSELAGNIDGKHLDDATTVRYFLTSRIGIQQSFESIAVFATDGHFISSRPSMNMRSVANEDWFKQSLKHNGTPGIREPFFSPLSGEAAVALTYPVHDEAGVLRAMVVGVLLLNQEQLLLSPASAGKTKSGNFILLTADHTIVMHPDPQYITRKLQVLGDQAEIIERGLLKPSISLIGANHLGVRSLYSFRAIPAANWTLISVVANEEAYASLSRLSKQMMLTGIVLAMLLFAAMWLLVSRMLKPLEHLRNEMRKMRTGASAEPALLGERATEELRQLAEEFSGMAAAWRTAEAALQQEKERAEVTLESIADGVIATTRDGTIAAMNRAAESITGWRSEDALGQPFAAVFPLHNERSGEPMPDLIASAIELGEVICLPAAVLQNSSGAMIPLHNSVAPIHAEHGSIDGAVVVFRNVAAERRATQQLEWRATHDAMTGVLNRAGYEQVLELLFESVRDDGPHALLMLDLDEFKIVNDTCGHAAGDELLKQLAQLFLRGSRKTDTVARLGGDEFAVLMPRCPGDKALRLAEALRAAIANFRFEWHARSFHVGASIGLVEINGSFDNATDVQKAADMACYMAKRGGRNRICLHSSEQDQVEVVRLEMNALETVRSAIAENRMRLFAQPITRLDLAQPQAQYFEILLRMVDEEGRIVPPSEFLPAAERYGMMDQLDRWVIATAAKTCAQRFAPNQWRELDTVSINLSAHTLRDPDIGSYIIDELNRWNVPFERVCFEVTETAAIDNLQRVAQWMCGLREKGLRFALDDFGVGMTSLAQLRDLPIDVLKIDGSFVHGIHDSDVNASLVEAIQMIAGRLSMKTVAECVEVEQELSHLEALGIDYVQGFLLARPGPLENIIGMPRREEACGQAAEAEIVGDAA